VLTATAAEMVVLLPATASGIGFSHRPPPAHPNTARPALVVAVVSKCPTEMLYVFPQYASVTS
jgi:hypothetical protein